MWRCCLKRARLPSVFPAEITSRLSLFGVFRADVTSGTPGVMERRCVTRCVWPHACPYRIDFLSPPHAYCLWVWLKKKEAKKCNYSSLREQTAPLIPIIMTNVTLCCHGSRQKKKKNNSTRTDKYISGCRSSDEVFLLFYICVRVKLIGGPLMSIELCGVCFREEEKSWPCTSVNVIKIASHRTE